MRNQIRKQLAVECDDLEWLYVPDVVYADYGNCERHLQLIVPYRKNWDTEECFPLILWIPGAAWYRQEMYNSLPAYAELAKRGYVVAALEIRESTIAQFPAQLWDVRRALEFLAKKAEVFHVDKSRVYLGGNSSGGHIALLTGLKAAEDRAIIDSQDVCHIRGLFAESAPTDMFICAKTAIPDFMPKDFRPVKDLLGVDNVEAHPDKARAASCEHYIRKEIEIPPILLFHGLQDNTVSVEHSRRLFRLLKEAGKEVVYYELVNGGHGGALYWSKEILDMIDDFIQKQEEVLP